MNKRDKDLRKDEVFHCICSLPRKMLYIHGAENMTEFVLHHLSDAQCFNFSKAAYFIDNPDFNVFKGIAGFHSREAFVGSDHWQDGVAFTKHMKHSKFNIKTRLFEKQSHKKEQLTDEEMVSVLSKELEFERPFHHAWPIKYDNHGLLLFELKNEEDRDIVEHYLPHSLYLFGFCPVF